MDAETDLETIHGVDKIGIDYVALTAVVVAAYLTNNHVQVAELPRLVADVHAALIGLGQAAQPSDPETQKPTPAQIRKSITPNALISFIDGKPCKTLKRHLTVYGMTIEEYRMRYGLPRDYPATAASYSAQRSALAKSAGLGRFCSLMGQQRKAVAKAATTTETLAEASKKRGRKKAD